MAQVFRDAQQRGSKAATQNGTLQRFWVWVGAAGGREKNTNIKAVKTTSISLYAKQTWFFRGQRSWLNMALHKSKG